MTCSTQHPFEEINGVRAVFNSGEEDQVFRCDHQGGRFYYHDFIVSASDVSARRSSLEKFLCEIYQELKYS
jgi:hypothetical protein